MSHENYPEILTALEVLCVKVLENHRIDKAQTQQIAHEIAESVRMEWGGTPIYICKGQEYELTERDKEIYAKWNGRNRHEICREYNISYPWLCKIIKHQRKVMIKKSQVDIFPVPDVPARRKA
jgi:Mor family transcriptional regulator